jgi:hypothetical protein
MKKKALFNELAFVVIHLYEQEANVDVNCYAVIGAPV